MIISDNASKDETQRICEAYAGLYKRIHYYRSEKNLGAASLSFMNNSIQYIYICSAGHSGSTLLDMLLGSHSQIESLGEIEHLSKNISLNTLCTCRKSIKLCTVWEKTIKAVGNKLNIDILQSPYELNMGFPNPQIIKDEIHDTFRYKAKRKYLMGLQYLFIKYKLRIIKPLLSKVFQSMDHTFLVYDTIRSQLGCQMVVDSSKSYIRSVGFYCEKPEHTRIILLTRDGRGVLYSNIKRNFPRNRAVVGWKRYYSRAIPLFDTIIDANSLIQVKYEDIIKDPSEELKRICSFINLKFEEDMLNFADHTHHITNGNNMRFSKLSQIRDDNSWKTKMEKSDLVYFDKHAGDINRRLGYL